MKWYRIYALLMRHLYLYKRSIPRIMDIFYWPVMDLLLWGFLSVYLQGQSLETINFITVIVGGLIFWTLLNQSQRAVSIAFLEDVWERNLLNIFVTPLKVSEFLSATVLLGLVRIGIISVVMGILAFVLYKFDLLQFGFTLIPFFANLLFFGWSLGILIIGIILRYGTQAQILAFGLIFVIQPFSAVFYPVSALPESIRFLAYASPATYVFEGMRQLLNTHTFSMTLFIQALVANTIYLILSIMFFNFMFSRTKKQGTLMKLE